MGAVAELRFDAAVATDLATIRAFVRQRAAAAGLAGAALDDLVQAVDEMATNVLVHGYGARSGPLRVTVEAGDDEVTVRLLDRAPAFDPSRWQRPDDDADWVRRRPGGFGIALTHACVDAIYHRAPADGPSADGNELTLVKRGRQGRHEPT